MAVPTTLRGISATAATNSPAGTDVIGSSLDDYLRSIQAVFRQYLASPSSDIASATTTDLSTATGFWVNVTGTTTITGLGTELAGIWYGLKFTGALTLTHNGTSLILPGAANITTAAGDSCLAESLGSGNWKIHAYQKASGLPLVGTVVPRSYLAGLTLSTAGSSATMSIAAGSAADSTNTAMMNLAASISKTTSAWSVGSGQGGLDTSSIANNTWYHFYEIMRVDTGVVDVVFSTSASSPTLPANYTLYRRIGAGLTNGSAQWVSFTQDGDLFLWNTAVGDVAANNPGTSAVSRTLTVPTGLSVQAISNWIVATGGTAANGLISELTTADGVPSSSNANVGFGIATANSAGRLTIRTNTSAQVRSRVSASDANVTLNCATLGWIDSRGRNA